MFVPANDAETVLARILNRASWFGNDNSGAGRTPHEQKMAGILGSSFGWRIDPLNGPFVPVTHHAEELAKVVGIVVHHLVKTPGRHHEQLGFHQRLGVMDPGSIDEQGQLTKPSPLFSHAQHRFPAVD